MAAVAPLPFRVTVEVHPHRVLVEFRNRTLIQGLGHQAEGPRQVWDRLSLLCRLFQGGWEWMKQLECGGLLFLPSQRQSRAGSCLE